MIVEIIIGPSPARDIDAPAQAEPETPTRGLLLSRRACARDEAIPWPRPAGR